MTRKKRWIEMNYKGVIEWEGSIRPDPPSGKRILLWMILVLVTVLFILEGMGVEVMSIISTPAALAKLYQLMEFVVQITKLV